ncbi:MAG TPA: tryptophan--tRNA ligase [Planctomycetota bacterium]|nr:tryptophan--tRNA ligase [Planctomycetota bacterium]
MPRVLSGIQPSGQLHLGNYAGAIRQFLDLQHAGNEMFVFVASYHALTSTRDPAVLRANIHQIVVDYLAFGLDPAKSAIYVQQDVPEVTELAWLLSCVTPMSWMEKAVSYKDKLAKGISANVGLFTYPILQAADILAVDADVVPVGRDQVQHLELARDMAARFNEEFKSEVFKLPAYRLAAEAAVLPGIDGEKMSKSYGNTIDPFQDEKGLRKRIMAIKSDSKGVNEVKEPDTCNTFQIFRAIAGKDDPRTLALANRYRDPGAEGFGYGHAKQALFDLLLDHFGPARAKRGALMADPGYIAHVLKQGADAARTKARAVTDRARAAVGL